MVIAWIVITLMLALLVGIIAGAMNDDGFGFGFFFGFVFVLQLSFAIGIIYVAGHFIGKYW